RTAVCKTRPTTFNAVRSRTVEANDIGIIAKYFATSFAMLNVVTAPRVISNCLPSITTSMILAGLDSRSTMFAASFAAWVPEFIANPTSAIASAGASLVPSPIIATILVSACSRLTMSYLSSGFASGWYSSIPTSAAMLLAVRGWSPVIMTGLMPITLTAIIFSLISGLRTSLNLTISIASRFLERAMAVSQAADVFLTISFLSLAKELLITFY